MKQHGYRCLVFILLGCGLGCGRWSSSSVDKDYESPSAIDHNEVPAKILVHSIGYRHIQYCFFCDGEEVYIIKYIENPAQILGQWYSNAHGSPSALFDGKRDNIIQPPFMRDSAVSQVTYLSPSKEEVCTEYFGSNSRYIRNLSDNLRITIVEDSNRVAAAPGFVKTNDVYLRFLPGYLSDIVQKEQ